MARHVQLSDAQLEQARTDYDAGATYAVLAARLDCSEKYLRRLLRATGGMSRPRGKRRIGPQTPDLILADWCAGLSCRAIAAKHGLADHKPVARFLKDHGVDVGARPARQKIPGVVLGRKVTDLQAARRRKPPMVIPVRSEREIVARRFSPLEQKAIEQELAAGRYRVVPRGECGLGEPLSMRERIKVWFAGMRVAARAA